MHWLYGQLDTVFVNSEEYGNAGSTGDLLRKN